MKINTSEQISLEFKPAGYGGRAIAYIIDFVIIWSVILAVWISFYFISSLFFSYDFFQNGVKDFSSNIMLFIFAFVPYFAAWLYAVNYEVGHQGVTPGKKIMGLRVIDLNGFPLTYKTSIIRRIFVAIDMLPFCGLVAFLSINLTKKKQRLGDLAAGTLVIHEEDVLQTRDLEIFAKDNIGNLILVKSEHYALLANYMNRKKALSEASRLKLEDSLAEVLKRNINLDNFPETEIAFNNNERFLEWIFVRAKPELENVT